MMSFVKYLPERRWLTFTTGIVECLFFTGAMFGWASLVFIVKEEGYYGWMCVNVTKVNVTQVLDCRGQDERLSLVFTIASFAQSVLSFPSGLVLDNFGTTVTRLCGIVLFTMGTLMIAFSTPALAFLLYPAITFIAVGGLMLMITNMQVGNLFQSRRSTIVTIYSGAHSSTAVLFLLVKLLYEAGISLYASFLFLTACSAGHLLRTLFLMPRTIIPNPPPEHYTYGITCCESKEESLVQAEVTSKMDDPVNKGQTDMEHDAQTKVTDTSPDSQERSFRDCMLSRFFIFHVIWLSSMILRHYIYIGTLNPMLQRITGGQNGLVSHYTTVFALTQLCAFLFSPWNGLIMERHRAKPRSTGESGYEADLQATVLPLALTTFTCVLFSISATIPILPLQYCTFVLQVINRSFLFGGHGAFINMTFPLCHFGKLYGLALATAGLCSLLQYPLFILVDKAFHKDPLYVNVGLTVFVLISFIHPISIYLHCRSLASLRATCNDMALVLSVTYQSLDNTHNSEARPIHFSVNPAYLDFDEGSQPTNLSYIPESLGLYGRNDK